MRWSTIAPGKSDDARSSSGELGPAEIYVTTRRLNHGTVEISIKIRPL